MSHSAYAPPQADLRTDREHEGGSGDFDLNRCMSEAWSDTWANFGLWLGVLVVLGTASVISVFTLIGIVLVLPVLLWGAIRFFLGMRDRTASFGDAFAGFGCYGAALGGMLLFLLAWILVGLPGQLLQQVGANSQNTGLQLAGTVVSLVTGVLVSPRLLFAPFLMVDRGLGGADALNTSWELTRPIHWKIVGLLICQMLLFFAGLVFFLVGIIPASVMGYLMLVSAYRQVVGGPPTPAER